MAYLRLAEARRAFQRRYPGVDLTASAADRVLRTEAKVPTQVRFDIFLSHSSLDALEIAGVKAYLEELGLSVYVDWLEDPVLDRTNVTRDTAALLRTRMRASDALFFVTSTASPKSKWMPWELGYFDGFRHGRVAILPLVETSDAEYKGQEYLGLYPTVEQLPREGGAETFVTFGAESKPISLRDFRAGAVW